MNKITNLRFQQIIVLTLTFLIMILLVFYGYRPESYNLKISDTSSRDITAQRDFIDSYATRRNAEMMRRNSDDVYIWSESISTECVSKVNTFLDMVDNVRNNRQIDSVNAEATNLKIAIENEIGFTSDKSVLVDLLLMDEREFAVFKREVNDSAEYIMMNSEDYIVTDSVLSQRISSEISSIVSNYSFFSNKTNDFVMILEGLLEVNYEYDAEATERAALNAYSNAMNDPVIVDKGTKIISVNEVVTEHIYSQLVDLELIRSDSFDLVILGRIAVYELIISIASIIYLANCRKNEFKDMKVVYTLVLTFLIPIAASIYLQDISNVMIVTLFFTTIVATYLGLSVGIVLSVAQMFMIWPLYSFDIEFLFVSIVGVLICSSIASNAKRSYNSASLIIFPALFCVLASVAYNWVMVSSLDAFIASAIWIGVSAMLATVIAIGLMPIYELFSNTVSPVKLIELSQPGRPLLKEMFIKAPGTYHHAMMVANLADSAAEAIGADSLLCKVAAYYHDIGKLENPMYFTENQSEGVNPHDEIAVEDSVRIITNHILDGEKLAIKHRLPKPIIRIINEHHGTTYPAYFYFKAKKIAEENGEPEPDLENFKYKGNVPSTRESAIVMIADTCEAAIRSMKLTDPAKIEDTVRDLIKKKIDQDQLSMSGLSFDDIEKIVVSFRQAYSGTFHERIQYPNEK